MDGGPLTLARDFKALKVDILSTGKDHVSPDLVADCQRRGIQVWVWTVNSLHFMERLLVRTGNDREWAGGWGRPPVADGRRRRGWRGWREGFVVGQALVYPKEGRRHVRLGSQHVPIWRFAHACFVAPTRLWQYNARWHLTCTPSNR